MLPQENLYDVFLSHSHRNADAVEVLAQKLEDEAGFRVWLDKWILVPGGHWQQEMAKGLNEAKTCAVCIGENTPTGWFREEIERALNRQTKDNQFRVIPVLLPDSDEKLVDNFLELRTWVDLRAGLDQSAAFSYLVSGIMGIPPGRNPVNQRGQQEIIAKEEEYLIEIRQNLTRIRILQREGLIGIDIVLEYQRKILDKMIIGFKTYGK
jgi:TIR domain-containing protein